MQQKGYSDLELEKFDPVHIAGMQTHATDILHGTFRAEMKLEGYNGGSCASFFWYHDDRSELDIEFVTPGTSIVNDTINYTSHPSINSNGTKIPNATVSIPLKDTLDEYKTHRFDCDAVKGVRYYLDNKLMHTDTHNVPKAGGSLQLKLWADGNKWWSGLPSKTDVFLKVKSITAYYNTTGSLTNEKWTNRCAREKKQCQAVTAIHSYNTKPATCIGSGCVGDASSKSHTSSSIVFKPVTSPQKSPSARRSLKIWLLAAWCLVVLFTVAR